VVGRHLGVSRRSRCADTLGVVPDAWFQPSRELTGERVCGRCAAIVRPPLGVGWVATTDPFPAWVCPACARAMGMQPGDRIPALTRA
jgi:hypothetical protein